MNSSTDAKADGKKSQFQDNLEYLRQINIFAGLPLEPLKVLAYLCSNEQYREGDYLFHKDDTDGQAFYFVSGSVRVIGEKDGKEIVMSDFGEGDFIGGLTLLGDIRRVFSMRAESDIECLVLTREKFMKTAEQFPDILAKVIETAIEEVRMHEEHFLNKHALDCESCREGLGVSLI
jgi:CRP-like cAMP-binding protein